MVSQPLFYPLHSVICCTAKAYLTTLPDAYESNLIWDEPLFIELADTLLQPTVQPLLLSSYGSRDEATVVEGQLAKALVNTYQRIQQQRQNKQIQQLNALL